MNSLTKHPLFEKIKRYVISSSGLSYYEDKDYALSQAVHKRMLDKGVEKLNEYYLALKNSDHVEFDELICLLTIGETHFFRNEAQFELMKSDVLPDIIGKNSKTKTLRIWSAGSSVGAEAYSIAILLEEHFKFELASFEVSILGTDINRQFLAQAKLGLFSEWVLRGLPDEYRKRYFTKTEDKKWKISEELKKRVNFQYHNLVKDSFPSLVDGLVAFDIILCRNVLIYFSSSQSKHMIGQFSQTLAENGWYFPGHAEIDPKLYESLNSVKLREEYLYRRKDLNPQKEAVVPQIAEPKTHFSKLKPSSKNEWQPLDISQIAVSESPEVKPVEVKSTENSERVAESNDLLDKLIENGSWDKAMSLCLERLEVNPLDIKSYFKASIIYESLGDYSSAASYVKKALYIDDLYVLAHYHLGLFAFKKEDFNLSFKSLCNTIKTIEKVRENSIKIDLEGLTLVELEEKTKMHLEVVSECLKTQKK